MNNYELSSALKAAVWLCDQYNLEDIVEALPVSKLPALQDAIEEAIVQAATDFAAGNTPEGQGRPLEASRTLQSLLAKAKAGEQLDAAERTVALDVIELLTDAVAETM